VTDLQAASSVRRDSWHRTNSYTELATSKELTRGVEQAIQWAQEGDNNTMLEDTGNDKGNGTTEKQETKLDDHHWLGLT
jgi:hypothetical protein